MEDDFKKQQLKTEAKYKLLKEKMNSLKEVRESLNHLRLDGIPLICLIEHIQKMKENARIELRNKEEEIMNQNLRKNKHVENNEVSEINNDILYDSSSLSKDIEVKKSKVSKKEVNENVESLIVESEERTVETESNIIESKPVIKKSRGRPKKVKKSKNKPKKIKEESIIEDIKKSDEIKDKTKKIKGRSEKIKEKIIEDVKKSNKIKENNKKTKGELEKIKKRQETSNNTIISSSNKDDSSFIDNDDLIKSRRSRLVSVDIPIERQMNSVSSIIRDERFNISNKNIKKSNDNKKVDNKITKEDRFKLREIGLENIGLESLEGFTSEPDTSIIAESADTSFFAIKDMKKYKR
ncbi:hypothetical protein A0H76_476 [Hepatospora eriocheir]|uniref:Uncharacterized protein n=1 Tax=Hepatospora eriocheir TaxID=1081669 RepID=A0A1X0Q965_9MICR|nr:hypothetical protein A0H76_476 [Hepatospora eriocheir]